MKTIDDLLRTVEGLKGKRPAAINEKIVRKPHIVKIDPEAFHRARVEALCSKRVVWEWLEEAIDEKIEREEKKVKDKRPAATGVWER